MIAMLGLAVGGYVLVDHKKTQEEDSAAAEISALKLFDFDENSINCIDISCPDGVFTASLSNGEWTLSSTDYPTTFPLNSFYFNSIATTMSELTALQKFDGSDLAVYGLDDPTVITCHSNDESYTLFIGKPSATKEYYYVSVAGSNTVHGIKYDTGAALDGGISYLHDPYVLHLRDADICTFALDRFGETAYDLYTDDKGQWQLKAPITDVRINTVKVSTIITDLVQLHYDSFLTISKDKDVLEQYGLDKPVYFLKVGTKDETVTLEFPDFDVNDGVVYCYEPETGTIGTISARETAYLTGTWQMLLDETVLRIPYADAKELDVTIDGKHFTLSIDHENKRTRLDDIDMSALDSETNKLFEYLYASVSEICHEEVKEDPQLPEDPVPAVTFRYTLNDDTERVLELVPIDDVTYWAYVDGRCVGQTVRRNALSGASGVLSFLEKMTDALEDQGITYTPAEAAPADEPTPAEETATESAPTEETTAETTAAAETTTE
jgi:hypothetical protein